jgi:hypothetical protein
VGDFSNEILCNIVAALFAQFADKIIRKTINIIILSFSSLLSCEFQLYYHMNSPQHFFYQFSDNTNNITGLKPPLSSGKSGSSRQIAAVECLRLSENF